MCEGIVDTCLVRGAAIPDEVQVEEPVPPQINPYGNVHGTEPAAPVLMQPNEAAASTWAPSAPPAVLNDQALRTALDHAVIEGAADQDTPRVEAAEPTKELPTLTEVDNSFRHIVYAGMDQSHLGQQNDR